MRDRAFIYVMSDDGFAVKIGITANVETRWKEVWSPRSNRPRIAYVSDMMNDAERIERMAHKLLELTHKRLGKRGKSEWFEASVEDAVQAVFRAERIVVGVEEAPEFPAPKVKRKVAIHLDYELVERIDAYAASLPHAVTRTAILKFLLDAELRRRAGSTDGA